MVQNYNVMGVAKAALEASVRYLANDLGPHGIRVNAISAGPIKNTGIIRCWRYLNMIKLHTERAPLRKQVDLDEVGDAALFLISPLSRGISGEVIYVDGGYTFWACEFRSQFVNSGTNEYGLQHSATRPIISLSAIRSLERAARIAS